MSLRTVAELAQAADIRVQSWTPPPLRRLTTVEHTELAATAYRGGIGCKMTEEQIELTHVVNPWIVVCDHCGIELAPGEARLARTLNGLPIAGMWQCRGSQSDACIDRSIQLGPRQ